MPNSLTRYDLLDQRVPELGMGIGKWNYLIHLTDDLILRALRTAARDHAIPDPYIGHPSYEYESPIERMHDIRMRQGGRFAFPYCLPWTECRIVGATSPDPICPKDIMLICVRYGERACAGYGVTNEGILHCYWDGTMPLTAKITITEKA